jgi:PAS domain S-box-containing protein
VTSGREPDSTEATTLPGGDWAAAFDAMDDAVSILALDGTVRRCNAALLRLLGLGPADVLGKKCYELMHDTHGFFEGCPYRKMLRTRRRESFETSLGGGWYDVTADPLFGGDGAIVGAVHVVRDITARVRAEQAHHESEQRLAAIVDCISDMVFSVALGPDGCFRFETVNRRFLEGTGFTREQVEGQLVSRVIPEPSLTVALAKYRTAIREDRTLSWEARTTYVTGERVGEVTVTPFREADGTCSRLVGSVHDLTERTRDGQAVREQSERLASINALALDLASLDREAELGTFLAARLRELTGAVAVAFSHYEPDARMLATRTIELQPGVVKTLTAPLLKRLAGTRSPVSPEAYDQILHSENATRDTLTEASFGAIPSAVDVSVRRLLGVDRFVGLAYVIEGELYGTSVLALKNGSPAPPRELLDSFANLAAVSLRRRRAELELREKTVEVDQMFALSDDIMGIADMGGILLRVNPAWETTLGYPIAEMTGRQALDFVHPDDLEASREAVADMVAGRPLVGFINRQRHRDGTYRLIEWHVMPFEGRRQFAVGRDITEREQARQSEEARKREAAEHLRRTSAYNRSLIEASLDPLVVIGPDGLITDVNEATLDATWRTRGELVGSDFAEYFTDPALARQGLETAFREGAVRDQPLAIRRSDGHLTHVLCNASIYRDADGKVAGLFAAARDVGALREAEEEIRLVNAELERRVDERTRELTATNRDLQEFMYSLSHDLRTPLRALDGFSFTVLEDYGDVIDPKGQDDLHRVRSAAQRMGVLIDALLSLSQLGHRRLDLHTVDLSQIAKRVIDDLRASDPERVVDVVIEDGLTAAGDEALITVVLENLLGNAWKFTSRRAVAHIEFGATERDGLRVFFVRDDGVGFDQAYAGKLFAPFQRLHAGDEFPGAGTGLATVARIVERLGGLWWAEGEPDRGATFFFSLSGGESARDPARPPDQLSAAAEA